MLVYLRYHIFERPINKRKKQTKTNDWGVPILNSGYISTKKVTILSHAILLSQYVASHTTIF